MKTFLTLLISIALIQCAPKNPGDTGGCQDSIKKDTVVVVPDDSMPLITHGDEIGPVEPMTLPMKVFREETISGRELVPPAFMSAQAYPSTRSIYLDRAHLMYKNSTETNQFAKYCKLWNFTEVHLYHFSDMVASSSNFPYIYSFCQTLRANGVKKIVAVLGSASTTGYEKLWASTTDTTKKPNGINLELEWWNSTPSTPIATWSEWMNTLNTLNMYCDSKNPDLQLSFYMGWYKNLGSLTDVQAATQQQQVADFIDLHIYQDGKVSATYGQSRWDADANAAKARGKIVVMNPIVSCEEKDWGYDNNFQGYYLKALGFPGLEKAFIDDWNAHASAVAKQWIKIGEFKYFMKRSVWMAIPPTI